MKILKYPNPILLQKALPVEINDDLRAWCKEAETFCEKVKANAKLGMLAGMAAPQMGRPIRAFVIHNYMRDPKTPTYRWFINPEMTWLPRAPATTMREGCYSLEYGNFNYQVGRQYACRIKWQDLEGNWHEEKFKREAAQIIQHEYDHLDGLCCNHEDNMKLNRKSLEAWAEDYGYKVMEVTAPDFLEKDLTQVEAVAIIHASTIQRLPNHADRKLNLDETDDRFQYDEIAPMEITPESI